MDDGSDVDVRIRTMVLLTDANLINDVRSEMRDYARQAIASGQLVVTGLEWDKGRRVKLTADEFLGIKIIDWENSLIPQRGLINVRIARAEPQAGTPGRKTSPVNPSEPVGFIRRKRRPSVCHKVLYAYENVEVG